MGGHSNFKYIEELAECFRQVGSFFYGIYLVLFCICMHILFHRPSNRGNTVLLVTAIALFTLSTVLTVLNLVLGTAEIDEMASIPYQKVQDAAFIIYAINNSIADGLVIYRCYVVWNNNWRVIVLPIMLLIASTVFGLDFTLAASPFFAITLATNLFLAAFGGSVASLGGTWGSRATAIHIFDSRPGIAPTLIIVRVGLGVSVESSQSTVRTATTSITLRPQRHAMLGTSIGSADPKENAPAVIEAGQNDQSFGKPRSLGEAAV
ncbi:hypothetical protein B0H13DRAFT_1916621 [Mycena leptocephala]|nr:hypothetical protein B0H13DRAFT_1916621 [Mycena leptocephala]